MSDRRIADVTRLIRQFKEQHGAAPAAPEDVCRHVALSFGVSDELARELIIQAGLRGFPSPPRGDRVSPGESAVGE